MLSPVESALSALTSPKRTAAKTGGPADWYPYYAGYSSAFVEDLLKRLRLPHGSKVLDPWNGMGTTTQVAKKLGHRAIGFDLNPVATTVAIARTLDIGAVASVAPLAAQVLETAHTQEANLATSPDPLSTWFESETARRLRCIELAIRHLLIERASTGYFIDLPREKEISTIAAFFYTVLFRLVKNLLSHFNTSNPTWLQQTNRSERLGIYSWEKLQEQFDSLASNMASSLGAQRAIKAFQPLIAVSCSSRLPLKDESIDCVITSPPYCTRIDYAVSTSPELAVLGLDGSGLKALRDDLIGTPTIGPTRTYMRDAWGSTCKKFLSTVEGHPSKAARSYYFKTYLQYFDGLHSSLREIARVLTSKASAAVVVQDSYFKEVHIDLASMVGEMAWEHGMQCVDQINFLQRRSMRTVNKHAQRYKQGVTAVESVVTLRKR